MILFLAVIHKPLSPGQALSPDRKEQKKCLIVYNPENRSSRIKCKTQTFTQPKSPIAAEIMRRASDLTVVCTSNISKALDIGSPIENKHIELSAL